MEIRFLHYEIIVVKCVASLWIQLILESTEKDYGTLRWIDFSEKVTENKFETHSTD